MLMMHGRGVPPHSEREEPIGNHIDERRLDRSGRCWLRKERRWKVFSPAR